MPLGKLDRVITIQNFTTSANNYGEEIKTWGTYATCWAEKIEASGGEDVTLDQIVAKQRVDFRIRYNSGVNEKMRILYASEYYNIENKQEEGRRDYLLLKTYKIDG